MANPAQWMREAAEEMAKTVGCNWLGDEIEEAAAIVARHAPSEDWIKVSERLPEESGEYIVWPGLFVDSHSAQFHNLSKQWTQSGTHGVVTQYITYWHPLPAPPVLNREVCK